MSEIRQIHADHQGAYGAPRVHAELCSRGRKINRKRVSRLMRINRIVGRHLRRKKRTTIQDTTAPPVPDLVMRDFTADMLNTKWCGDITYVAVGSTWLYLATVIDICSRRVIGWSIADHMRTSLVTDEIEMAVAGRGARCHLEVPVRGSEASEYLDLLCLGPAGRTAIEFKCVTRQWSGTAGTPPEEYALRGHNAPDVARRDFLRDVGRLERVCDCEDQNGLARLADSLERHRGEDPERLADAVLLELLPPGGATDDTALVIVRL